MDSGHSILNFKTQGSMLMLGVQEEKQELQDSEHRAVVLGCCCGLAECLWTCPWGLLFFSFRAGNLAQILNVFRSIWRTFTAVSLKTLCQQLPSSVAPTFHELFILLCMPLWPAEGQEGEGQPAQCLPCSHASSCTRKGIFFCPNFLDHSLHQGQLYHECMLHDRVPFQYHVIWLWTKARPSLSFLQPEVQPRLWRTGWGLHQFVVSSPLSNFGTAGAGAYLQKKFQLGTKRTKPSRGSELISILKLFLL